MGGSNAPRREGAAVMAGGPAILGEGLRKSFGETVALDGLDLRAERGTVLAVLGPNGAGKTTAVRIFTTLLPPDGGRAEVDGLDVTTHPGEVRARVGLTGQYAAVDEYLTGPENLEMVGRLSRLSKRDAGRRARELMERFELTEAGNRLVKTYSGGMRRKLDLAASLVAFPEVVFLDEPTTGLDPRARFGMWDMIRDLVGQGTTILLTTQYLEEADLLADRIAVIDHGKVIASGTSDELKSQAGGTRLEVRVGHEGSMEDALRVVNDVCDEEPYVDETRRTISVSGDGMTTLTAMVRSFDGAGVRVDDIHLRRPTLDDVFLKLTGHIAEEDREAQVEMAEGEAR
jgi:ABC-2 type transport system ATP-binding protein